MRFVPYYVLGIILGACLIGSAQSKESHQLNEIQKLKAENIKLKQTLLQCQVNVANSQISVEKSQFESEARKSLEAKDKSSFDVIQVIE